MEKIKRLILIEFQEIFEHLRNKYGQEEGDRRLSDLNKIIENAYVLFDGDEEKIVKWLMSDNSRWFNVSPFNMAVGGAGDKVVKFQEELLGIIGD